MTLYLNWVWWAQDNSGTTILCTKEAVHFGLGFAADKCLVCVIMKVFTKVFWSCCVVSLHSCSFQLRRMFLDALCCSFVYLNVCLWSQPFLPKSLEPPLKVVYLTSTRSLAFPAFVCAMLGCGRGRQQDRGPRRQLDSWKKVLLPFQQCITILLWSAPGASCRSSGLSLGISRG